MRETNVALAELEKATDQQLPTATTSVARKITDLTATASEVKDRQLAASVALTGGEAIGALQKVAEKDPALAAGAIKEVRKAPLAAGFHGPIGAPVFMWGSAVPGQPFAYSPVPPPKVPPSKEAGG